MITPPPLESNCLNATAQQRGRPMFHIRGLVSVLDKNEDQVLRLIEDGELLWAFDLSLMPERARRRELRVLPQCVEDFIAGRPCKLEWDQVKGLVLPHDKPILTSLEIERSLNCSQAHVAALIRRKLLTAASIARRGRNGSIRVPTFSFLDFLKGRRFF